MEHKVIDGKRKRIIKKLKTGTVFLTPEEVQEIEETFRLFDADNSDNIDLNELNIAMKALGLSKTRK